MTIKNNTIVDNQYETNAMNGGSGISIYDSNGVQTAIITGNRIEQNLWGITVIGGKEVNIGKTENPAADDYNPGHNIFKDNGNGGKLYDLYQQYGPDSLRTGQQVERMTNRPPTRSRQSYSTKTTTASSAK